MVDSDGALQEANSFPGEPLAWAQYWKNGLLSFICDLGKKSLSEVTKLNEEKKKGENKQRQVFHSVHCEVKETNEGPVKEEVESRKGPCKIRYSRACVYAALNDPSDMSPNKM